MSTEDPTESSREGYRKLLENLEAFQARVRKKYDRQITCGQGCFSCCRTRLSVFPLEADSIRRQAGSLSEPNRQKLRERLEDDQGPLAEYCGFLVDGACSIYDSRPLLCRIHGLPNASKSYPDGAIDFCELNFTEMSADEIDPSAVMDGDHAGQALALLNFKFTQARPREPQGRLRIPLLELARELTGLDTPVTT